jgi:hypothetical protein
VRFTFIPFVSIFVNASQASRLLADPQAVSITEDVPSRPSLVDSVPLIKAPQVWAKGVTGSPYSLAIIDTGVDKTHFSLSGSVVSEACYSTHTPPSRTSLCPGRVLASTALDSGLHCSAAVRGCDHGTHVASIAAGDGGSVRGVAPDASIIAIQVFTRHNTEAACGKGAAPCALYYATNAISGMERAYVLRTARKVAAVNISIAGGKYRYFCDDTEPAYAQAFDKLLNAGILVSVASGNSSYNGYLSAPACLSKAVAVGATDKSDNIAGFGNKAQQLKLLAPGVDIDAAVPGNGRAAKSGTSQAAPHVAGAVALLKDARPKARADEILAALACGGIDIPISGYEKPRINLLAAYNLLVKPPTTLTTFSFNAASQASSWQPLLGAWSISSGHYRPSADGKTHVRLLEQDRCNGSATYETRVKRANAGGGAYGFEGFIYRASISTSPPAIKFASGYLAFVTNNYGNNDFVGIVRLTNHNLSDPNLSFNSTSFRLICYDNTPNNNFGDYNALKVVNQGGRHIVHLNGAKACEGFDFGYFGDRVALFSGPQFNAGDFVGFDSFKITPTDRAVPQ